MVKQRLYLTVFLPGILAALLIPAINADPVKKATEVTFGRPVEIPGMVLHPGTYIVKVPDPVSHADMVGFYNLDQSHLYKLVRTIPAYRTELTETLFTYEERAKGAPDAIKTWFYRGDYWGREFVYEKAQNLTVAEEAAPPPAPEETPAPAEVAVAPAPEPVFEAPAAPAEPVEIAEAAPPPAPVAVEAAPEAPVEELPKTASPMPLIGLFGVVSLALGLALRRLPNGAAN